MNYEPYKDVKITPPPIILPPVLKESFTLSQKLLAVACLILGCFYANMFVFSEGCTGRTAFTLALLIVSYIFMRVNNRHPSFTALSSGILCAAFSFGFIIVSSSLLQFICAVLCQLLYTYFVYKTYDSSIEKAPSNLLDFDLIKAVLLFPFASFGKVFPAAFSKNKGPKITKSIFYIIAGLALSVIPTAVVISLLSFDDGFKSLIEHLLIFNSDRFNIGVTVFSIIFGIPVGMYIFGLWFSSEKGILKGMNTESCTGFRRRLRFVPLPMSVSASIPIIAVYVIFFISQFNYFTDAFRGSLPDSFSYSEYARNGFFELCAVTLVNTLMLVAIYLFTKKHRKGIVTGLLTSLLSLSTVFLVAVAASKMLLYINYYGLTLKRIYTLWFMLTLALICFALILKAVIKKFPIAPVVIAITLVMTALLIFSNPPKAVSEYNTEAVLSGESITLDCEYFEQLGCAAIPDALIISQNEELVNKVTYDSAHAFLQGKLYMLDDKPSLWELNITEADALRALAEYDTLNPRYTPYY